MLKYEEIKDVIENQLGIKSPDDFTRYCRDKGENGASEEEIQLLLPEKVDCKDFWRYLDEVFPRAICASSTTMNPEEADRINFEIHQYTGAWSYLQYISNRYANPQILEIGPGWGNIAKRIKTIPTLGYEAIDVVPRFPDVVEFNGWTIPKFDKRFDIVYSVNVFQHLSIPQRQSLYKQVYESLNDVGCFILAMPTLRDPKHLKLVNDKYICHYGQYTEIQSERDIYEDLAPLGFHLLQANHTIVHGMSMVVMLKQEERK